MGPGLPPLVLDVVVKGSGRADRYTGRYLLTRLAPPEWQHQGSPNRYILYSQLDGSRQKRRCVFCRVPTPTDTSPSDGCNDRLTVSLASVVPCGFSTPPQKVGAWVVFAEGDPRIEVPVGIDIPGREANGTRGAVVSWLEARGRNEVADQCWVWYRDLWRKRKQPAKEAVSSGDASEEEARWKCQLGESASRIHLLLYERRAVVALTAQRPGRQQGAAAGLWQAENEVKLTADEGARRRQVHAGAWEGLLDLHRSCLRAWAKPRARADERRGAAEGLVSAAPAVEEAEGRRAVEWQYLTELATVCREAGASRASAERRARGSEALTGAEAHARAAVEARQRAARAEATREWEQRAAQLHRAAAAEELEGARAAADAERERAAAAERAAAQLAAELEGVKADAERQRAAAQDAAEQLAALRAGFETQLQYSPRSAAAALSPRQGDDGEREAASAAADEARVAQAKAGGAAAPLLGWVTGAGLSTPRPAAGSASPPPTASARRSPSPRPLRGGGREAPPSAGTGRRCASRRSKTMVPPRPYSLSASAEQGVVFHRPHGVPMLPAVRHTVTNRAGLARSFGDIVEQIIYIAGELKAMKATRQGGWKAEELREKGAGKQLRICVFCELSEPALWLLTRCFLRKCLPDGSFRIVTPSGTLWEDPTVPVSARNYRAATQQRALRPAVWMPRPTDALQSEPLESEDDEGEAPAGDLGRRQ